MLLSFLFLAGIVSLIAGMLAIRFNKPLGKLLFILSLTSFAAGGLAFSLEKSADAEIIGHFNAGGALECRAGGEFYTVGLAEGWTLQGGDHFVKDSAIVRAGNCEAVK
ncbi:MAG: hypothetical protein AB7E49_06920 [Campylobacterales bacterium]